MKNKKTFIIISLALILTALITLRPGKNQSANNTLNPAQIKTQTQPPVTIDDYSNIKIILKTNNGSLPPEYHRENTLIISRTAKGLINAAMEIRDYDKVIENKNFTISRDEFENLVTAGLNYQNSVNSTTGCPGSSIISLEILRNDEKLVGIDVDSCSANPVYKNLEKFLKNINR